MKLTIGLGILCLWLAAAWHSWVAFAPVEDAPANQNAPDTSADPPPVEVETIVSDSCAAVWRAWTTTAGLRAWFSERADIDLRIGGRFEILFSLDAPAGERGSEGCQVLSYLPHEMLSFSWSAPPKFAHARPRHTWVVVRIEAVGARQTRVRLVHLGFAERAAEFPAHAEEWRSVRAYFGNAWPRVLKNLAQHFEHREPTEKPATP